MPEDGIHLIVPGPGRAQIVSGTVTLMLWGGHADEIAAEYRTLRAQGGEFMARCLLSGVVMGIAHSRVSRQFEEPVPASLARH